MKYSWGILIKKNTIISETIMGYDIDLKSRY